MKNNSSAMSQVNYLEKGMSPQPELVTN